MFLFFRRALQKFCSSKASPVYSEQLVFEVKGTVYDWVFCDTTLSGTFAFLHSFKFEMFFQIGL